MSSNGCILGFNSTSSVCATVGTVLVGAGSGVVLRRGSDSTQWVPGDGRYLIDKLVYSPVSHLLCVTEKRLNVVLHVFKYPGFSCIQKVENIARVEIQDMLFSSNGQMLAVLTRMPLSSVIIFAVQRGRTLEKCITVDLSEKFWKCLVFPPQRTDCVAVLESDGVVLVSQLLLTSLSPNVVALNSCDNRFYSCCWCSLGLLCGAQKGLIFLCEELHMNVQNYLECPTTFAVTSLLQTDTLLLAGTEDGSVFGYDFAEKQLKLLLCIESPVERILLSGGGTDVFFVSDVGITTFDLGSANSSVVRARSFGNTVKILTIGMLVIWVAVNGDLMQYDKGKNTVFYLTRGVNEKAVDACVVDSSVVVIYDNGSVCCFLVDVELKCSSHLQLSDLPLCVCASDGASYFVVSDDNRIYFLTSQNGIISFIGSMDTFTARVNCLRCIPGEVLLILVACSNAELQLVCYSKSENALSGSLVLENAWRLDYPVHDFLPLYVDGDVINILVHSFDRDTKLYVLERRKDRDVKPLRPLFLMRDHEGGAGSVLCRLGESTIISGGTDGKVVLRDISHYLVKLTPIPPSKEKRRPQGEYMLRPFGRGGITFLCAWDNAGGFVCGGNDTVIHLIFGGSSVSYSWSEPVWCKVKDLALIDGVEALVDKGDAMVEQSRKQLLTALNELRVVVDGLLKERTSAIHVEDFLLPFQRAAFNSVCDMAINKAKDDDYYSILYNEFIQHTIKRECWDTMEVMRLKIVSLNDPKLVVYNFHCSKARSGNAKILKKLKFLRILQIKDGDYFTFSSVVKRPGNHHFLMHQEKDVSDDISELLYDPLDVYTNLRAVIQMHLLCEKILKVKMSFNACFDSLFERKRRELRRIEERNERCRRIIKQLGEPVLHTNVLFTPVFDVEEDPKAVFEVFDSEIDPELLKLAKNVNDTEFVISQSDEAALKTWMDGLEKDAEVLAVKVTLPAFADESLEQYVAPDERTEEQQKAYEQYEKELAEKTAYVNERKEALREEMNEMVKANETAAKKIDDEILSMRKQRMNAFELIDELECNQVNALRRLFIPTTICNELRSVIQEKIELQGHLKQLQSLEAYRQGLVTAEEAKLKKSTDKEKGLVAKMRHVPPFDDSSWGDKLSRRFTRWYAKYEQGTAKVPLPEQHDAVPVFLWELYCEFCSTIVKAKDVVARHMSDLQASVRLLELVETEIETLQSKIAEKEAVELSLRQGAINRILNVQSLYRLRQGQVQDECAKLNTDFVNFSFRRAKDVLDLNALIFSSFDDITKLMGKISQKRHAMKMSTWHAERLQYSVGTLEMELRQLHTLRVTRQMQESIHTGAVASHESEVDKLNRQLEYVRQVMSKKVEERNRIIARLNMQISDRNMENANLDEQVRRTKSVVNDKKAVWSMLGQHSNEEKQLQTRMKELYENSELEELARCQQEELFRLKREVNRLRERTFPSFAVVSKRTIN